MNTNLRISQFSGFLLRPGPYAILVKIWKWLKLLYSVPLMKKTFRNHVYSWIWSFGLTLTVLQWMKTNVKISQLSRFLLRPRNTISFKIWKWLKLLHSVPLMKKTFRNHVYSWIWSFGLTLTVLQWMKTNVKISQLSRFLLRTWNTILVKIWKWLKLLNSVPFIKKTHANHYYNRIWSYLTDFHSFTVNEDKPQN